MPRIPPSLVIRNHDPARLRKLGWVLLVAWLASLMLVALVVAELIPRVQSGHGELHGQQKRDLDAARTRIAVLERSEQVAKTAVETVQANLREREEEIDSLRSDLAFYGRLVGGTKRQGLAVPIFKVAPVDGSNAWNFNATITQNFKRNEEMHGRLSLSVEGIDAGKLRRLDWDALQQHADAAGVTYAFKYFERVSGTIMLPPGFEPNRVRVRLEGDGTHVEQEFAWEDAAKGEETTDVQQ